MFGKILKRLRQENNISQEELAKILGISKSAIGMYELGKRMPHNEFLKQIANYFSVSIDYLLGFETPSKSIVLTSDEEKVITAYREQPPMQEAVKRLLGIE